MHFFCRKLLKYESKFFILQVRTILFTIKGRYVKYVVRLGPQGYYGIILTRPITLNNTHQKVNPFLPDPNLAPEQLRRLVIPPQDPSQHQRRRRPPSRLPQPSCRAPQPRGEIPPEGFGAQRPGGGPGRRGLPQSGDGLGVLRWGQRVDLFD